MMTSHKSNVKEILSKNMLVDGHDVIMDLETSSGSWMRDERYERPVLDMFSMFASGSVGYNHPKILAQKERLGSAGVNKVTLSDIYCKEFAQFVDTFNKLAIPKELPHTFFIEGGALAVENALKTAFDWKVRKNLAKGHGKKGSLIIHFKEAFHGRSGYTLSLTNTADPRKTDYFPKFDWPRISNPKIMYPFHEEEMQYREQKALQEIKEAITNNPHEIAGLIIEPIQGEGGDNHFRPEFFVALREICDENDILFIVDEVQTGIGITGKMWAYEHFGIVPDIICFGKKTQVCGILASRRIEEVDNHVFAESSRINSTFGGNLVDMVRFEMILNIIKDDQLIENAATQGAYFVQELHSLASSYPQRVSGVRGKGLMCAFDLPTSTERNTVISKIFDNGMLVLGAGDRTIRFRPHLIIQPSEIDTAIDIIRQSLDAC